MNGEFTDFIIKSPHVLSPKAAPGKGAQKSAKHGRGSATKNRTHRDRSFRLSSKTENTLKRILVALDFSDPAHRALSMAIQLARPVGAKLSLIHVVPVFTSSEVFAAKLEEVEREMQASATARLNKIAAKLTEMPVDVHVSIGAAAEDIVQWAEKLDADLIVVGSTGKGAIKRLLLGSVADQVAHLSSGPVLIVK